MRHLALSLGFFVTACASARRQVPVRDGRDATIGCYQFQKPSWSSLILFGNSDSVASTVPPTRVELHLTGRVTPSISLLGPRFGALQGEWRLVRRDSLRLLWSDGATVATFMLVPHGDSLIGSGVIRAYHVHGVESPTTTVGAIKTSCT